VPDLHGVTMLMTGEPVPLFSVIRTASSDVAATEQSLAAVRAQGIEDFEYIVVCDDSNAAYVRHLTSAAAVDPRIKLLQAEAANPGERLVRALRLCRGTYVVIAPVDGTFAKGAFERVQAEFESNSDIGGLCGNGFLVDAHGRSIADVDIVTLLLSSYRPYMPAGFLRRSALVHCGLGNDGWSFDAVELEIWCRLATDFGVRSAEFDVVKAASPKDEVFARPQSLEQAIQGRFDVVAKFLSSDGFFGEENPTLSFESRICQLAILQGQVETLGFAADRKTLDRQFEKEIRGLRALLMSDHRVLETLHRLSSSRAHGLGPFARPLLAFLDLLKRSTGRLPIHAAYTLWNFWWLGPYITRKMFARTLPASGFGEKQRWVALYADLYDMVAAIYDSRGQIEQALSMWKRAGHPEDIKIASLAFQALLKLPNASDAEIADRQRDWIAPFIRDIPPVPSKTSHDGARKIRVGYHCAFMNSDTIRFQMSNAIASHDRQRFEVYGYSPQRFVEDRMPPFDVYRHTPSPDRFIGDPLENGSSVDDKSFVDIVRRDRLDVFVELSGYTPGHRMVAMGHRIAPIQISYLNHLGSTHIPNVDYVIGDGIATPPNAADEPYYREKIYRLARCFFCFDYRASDEPPPAEPPSVKNGFVTFGYFGGGSKLNIRVIEVWAKLLHRVPGSKLHVRNSQLSRPDNRRFLLERFTRFGISNDRLIVAGGVDRATLMKLYAEIDVSLDTWPYCGGNTIAESLWQGVPVVTFRGEKFINAYGASLVTAAGCGDLVGDTLESYLNIAANLAADRGRLISLRGQLRSLSVRHGLADSTDFARHLEWAYSDMLGQPRAVDNGARASSLPSLLATPS